MMRRGLFFKDVMLIGGRMSLPVSSAGQASTAL